MTWICCVVTHYGRKVSGEVTVSYKTPTCDPFGILPLSKHVCKIASAVPTQNISVKEKRDITDSATRMPSRSFPTQSARISYQKNSSNANSSQKKAKKQTLQLPQSTVSPNKTDVENKANTQRSITGTRNREAKGNYPERNKTREATTATNMNVELAEMDKRPSIIKRSEDEHGNELVIGTRQHDINSVGNKKPQVGREGDRRNSNRQPLLSRNSYENGENDSSEVGNPRLIRHKVNKSEGVLSSRKSGGSESKYSEEQTRGIGRKTERRKSYRERDHSRNPKNRMERTEMRRGRPSEQQKNRIRGRHRGGRRTSDSNRAQYKADISERRRTHSREWSETSSRTIAMADRPNDSEVKNQQRKLIHRVTIKTKMRCQPEAPNCTQHAFQPQQGYPQSQHSSAAFYATQHYNNEQHDSISPPLAYYYPYAGYQITENQQ